MSLAPPSEPVLPIDTCQALLTNALVDAGIIGIDEAPEQPILNRTFTQANWLLAQWARKRWLCYRIQDYAFVTTGADTYLVGNGQTVNINPRPDRLEYAFLRFLNQSNLASGSPWSSGFSSGFGPLGPTGGSASALVDIPINIIKSHEDYSRITVKFIGTLPWRIFYDPLWPIGVLFPWPIPQPSIYEIHVGFKVVLPRFSSIQQPINFPPEYEAALNWCLARRLRVTYQMPADPEINALARDALNAIRLANTAVGVLPMPSFLRNRNRGYDVRGDTDS